eukprot:scaffold3980_cov348-Prasinococcus_capsulatus_cf.AAC.1
MRNPFACDGRRTRRCVADDQFGRHAELDPPPPFGLRIPESYSFLLRSRLARARGLDRALPARGMTSILFR